MAETPAAAAAVTLGVDERLARKLERRAVASTVASALAGVLLGFLATPFLRQAIPLPGDHDLPAWAAALVLGFIGWAQGSERALGLRVQAQMLRRLAALERPSSPPSAGQ